MLAQRRKTFNHYPAELNNLNFHPLEVVSRYRDPQLHVGENYAYLFIFMTKNLQFLMVKHTFFNQ